MRRVIGAATVSPHSSSRSTPSRLVRRCSSSDLDVVIDDEHTFVLSKRQMAKYCGRLATYLVDPGSGIKNSKRQRLVLRNFPGGAAAFEMAASFCYSGGKIATIDPSNLAVIRAAAEELEMTEAIARGNLVSKAEEALGSVDIWQWLDLLAALKGCDSVLHMAENLRIVHRLAFAVAGKIASSMEEISLGNEPSPMSPDKEPRSSLSSLSLLSPRTWWFADVCGISFYLMERVVRALFTVSIDHRYISRFLLYCLKTKLASLGYSPFSSRTSASGADQGKGGENGSGKEDDGDDAGGTHSQRLQREVLETIVSLLGQLEPGSTTCRSLFAIYGMAVGIGSSKLCRSQVERMIGLQLHNATLDNLLIPSSVGGVVVTSVYDVDAVLRLLWYFLKSYVAEDSCSIGEEALTKVGMLVDKYLSEVAPDPHLHPQKLLRLAKVLPDCSRVTDDRLYRAVDLYLEAHPFIRNADTRSLCGLVSYQKLSPEACSHVAQNPRFPAPVAVRTLMAQKELLKRSSSPADKLSLAKILDQGESPGKSPRKILCKSPGKSPAKIPVTASPESAIDRRYSSDAQKQQPAVIDSRVFETALLQNEELRWGLQAMHAKVTNLEKLCKSMRNEVVDSVRMKGMMC